MDSSSTDQRKTHTPGHEGHGVHVCHKCGWHFPNPHPSAKHRRAHKKICGTIEGYKLCFSEGQSRSNASDDEHGSDDDRKSPGPKALDKGNNEKGRNGIGEKINRSEDEMFSDAVADFTDSGLSQGVKEHLQEICLDSGTISVEGVDKKDPTSSQSSEENDIIDVRQLAVESRDDCEIQHLEILQGERVELTNTRELEGQLSGSAVDPLSNSVADWRDEKASVVRGDDISSSSNGSHPCEAEDVPDVLPENEIGASENVTNCSLASAALDTDLIGKDEIKSTRDEVDIGVPREIVERETCEEESKIVVNDAIYSDHQLVKGAVKPKGNDCAEFLSVLIEDDPPLGSNYVVISNAYENDVHVESAHEIQFANYCDVEILQEKEEGNSGADVHPSSEDTTDALHSQSEYEDSKEHMGLISQNLSDLDSYASLKNEDEDFKNPITEENILTEKSDMLSLDMHVMDSSGSMNKEMVNIEPMVAETHAEEHASPLELAVESLQSLVEISAYTNAIKDETSKSHMVQSSEELGPADVESSHQISLPESVLMVTSNENLSDTPSGAVTSETTRVVSIENVSHHENNGTEINDVALDGKDVGTNLQKDLGAQTTDLQPSDQLQLEIKQSSDVFKSNDAGEMDKIEKLDVTDTQCRKTTTSQIESPVISEAAIDGSTLDSKGIESMNIAQLSGAKEDSKEVEINSNVKLHEECHKSIVTSSDSHQTREAEQLVKAAEDLAEKYASLSSNAEPSAHRDFAGAVPVQDQSSDDLVKHSSSGIDDLVVSSSRCDSLEANWGSVSVLSMQSDVPAATDAETSPPTGLMASAETRKSNLNDPKAASERQQSGKSEMFEAPSFMTLVEPGHAAGHKMPASECQKGKNPVQPSSALQAGWFSSSAQITNEAQGRSKNEEIIAKVTNWGSGKEHTPLKSLLGEASHIDNPRSPKFEENSASQKYGKAPENNGSGLTTVNSILGPESPMAQAAIGDAAKEWNSPARYPAEMKREKRKAKSRPYWIQLVCCSSVDFQRR